MNFAIRLLLFIFKPKTNNKIKETNTWTKSKEINDFSHTLNSIDELLLHKDKKQKGDINTKILTKLIISDKTGNHLIKDNDFILIYGKSKVFRNMLLKAVQDGVKFKVAFVDNRKNNQIKSEIEYLTKLGITVVYTYLNGVSGIIKKVTKVFIKGKSMLSNGYLQGQVGTSLIACIANNFKKPVIAFCQTFKFWDKLMLDSLQKNNFAKTQCVDENDGIKYNQMELEYDITPANYINMVCCELGYIPPTSVPVVIREFGQKEIEL